MKCEVGDIIVVNNFEYADGSKGTLHYFVIIAINKDEFEIVNLDYLCFLISSVTSKNNNVNINFPFNEPISPTDENGLKFCGHVKCDMLYETIKESDIIMRLGKITDEQYDRFMELYEESQK